MTQNGGHAESIVETGSQVQLPEDIYRYLTVDFQFEDGSKSGGH